MSIFPHEEVPTIEVVPVGDPPDAVVREVIGTVEETLEVAPTVRDPISPPEDADLGSFRDAVAYQRGVERASDGDLVIGVTDDDLAWKEYDADAGEYRIEEDVFGLSQVSGTAAVVSTPKLEADDPSDERIRERLRKVTRRYLGMMFGYEDCTDCVNEATTDLAALDEKPADFCADCARRLRDPETAPEPDDWHVTTEEIEELKRLMRGDYHLYEYPLFAIGWLLIAFGKVRRKLPSLPRPSLSRQARAFVHETYRVTRFWWLAFTFLLSVGAVALALFDAHESLFGGEPSTVGAWALFVVSLLLGWLVFEIVRGVVVGLVVGTYHGLRGNDLGAEE